LSLHADFEKWNSKFGVLVLGKDVLWICSLESELGVKVKVAWGGIWHDVVSLDM
jgi:hypothetical protein